MNALEEFAELRKQFQRLHTQLDQDMLFLNVCHWPDDKSQPESAAEHCKVPIEHLRLMHIPIVHPKNHSFLFEDNPRALLNEVAAASVEKQNRGLAQHYIVGFPEANRRPHRRLKVAYLKCPNETTRQVARQFRSLAQRAGAALPSSVSDAIPTFFDTNSYIDKWLEFVFWQHPPSLDELLHLNSTRDTFLSSKPCDESARAIAECGLNTANPAFRPRRGHWPEWAGYLPGSQRTEIEPVNDEVIHNSGEEPPADYRRDCKAEGDPIGPVVGTRTALGFALHDDDTLSDQAYRKNFKTKLETGAAWVRHGVNERKLEMFVKSFGNRDRCDARLELFPHRVQGETKGN